MLRSFIAQSQPLLSHLRLRAAAALAPGGAKPWILPSRAYATEDGTARRDGAGWTTAAAAAANLRRHLYVHLQARRRRPPRRLRLVRRLPEPALRLGVSMVEDPHFEALGNNVVITGHSYTISRDDAFFLTVVYDTKTAKLDGGSPPYGPEPVDGDDFPEPARDWWPRGSCQAAPVGGDKLRRSRSMPQATTTMSNRTRCTPDGRTIFASSSFTFSLDTEGCQSARRGDWRLPFHGQGYYTTTTVTWTHGGSKGHPYLCSCDVPKLVDAEVPVQEPARKMCDEELTFLQTPVSFGCRTLVHTGRGQFCLVEVVPAIDANGEEATYFTQCLLHVTMFRAKHCKDGNLVVTPCRPGRSYLVPNCSLRLPGAFWI
ncbi:hypothetical protein VPH35_094524 [Triticum aestivum]